MTMFNLEAKSKSEATRSIQRGREILLDLKACASLTSEQQSWLDGMEVDIGKLREAR